MPYGGRPGRRTAQDPAVLRASPGGPARLLRRGVPVIEEPGAPPRRFHSPERVWPAERRSSRGRARKPDNPSASREGAPMIQQDSRRDENRSGFLAANERRAAPKSEQSPARFPVRRAIFEGTVASRQRNDGRGEGCCVPHRFLRLDPSPGMTLSRGSGLRGVIASSPARRGH